MKKTELKGTGEVTDRNPEIDRNLELLRQNIERLAMLIPKEQLIQAVNEAWDKGEARGATSQRREQAITDLRKVITGEENNG